MTYVITDECIMCGSCEPFCEQGAIIEDEHNKYFIDLAKCDACGTCVEYCPIDDAIMEVDEKTLVNN